MTLENKLYYVRAGIRTGAMQFSLGMKAPRYLFLHKKDSFILFLLKEVEPRLVSASYLQIWDSIPLANNIGLLSCWILKLQKEQSM